MQKFLTMNRDSTQLCLTSKRRDLRKRKNLYCCEKQQEKSQMTHSAWFWVKETSTGRWDSGTGSRGYSWITGIWSRGCGSITGIWSRCCGSITGIARCSSLPSRRDAWVSPDRPKSNPNESLGDGSVDLSSTPHEIHRVQENQLL